MQHSKSLRQGVWSNWWWELLLLCCQRQRPKEVRTHTHTWGEEVLLSSGLWRGLECVNNRCRVKAAGLLPTLAAGNNRRRPRCSNCERAVRRTAQVVVTSCMACSRQPTQCISGQHFCQPVN